MLDVLLPPCCLGCGRLLRSDAAFSLCTRCRPELVALPPAQRRVDDIEALFAYEGPLAPALARLKFSGEAALAGPLGRLLSLAPALRRDVDIVPVPLHWTRILRRGFNQSQLIAWWAVRHARIDPRRLRPGLLRRRRRTAPQTGLSARERQLGPANAFEAPPPAGRRGVLVVDDVTTTGATLRACIDALREAGIEDSSGLALFRTLA